MLNPERILGSLVTGALRGKRGSISGAAVGMGLLGVAIAAAEHFSEKRSTGGQMPSTTPSAGAGPPPLPSAQPPPPPPPAKPTRAPEPPSAPLRTTSEAGARAMLLVRAMVAAAAADGHVDGEERGRILARMDEGDSRDALDSEMASPRTAEQIAAEVGERELGEEVYAASLLAIRVDTEAEHAYLQRLAGALALDPAEVERLHRIFAVSR